MTMPLVDVGGGTFCNFRILEKLELWYSNYFHLFTAHLTEL